MKKTVLILLFLLLMVTKTATMANYQDELIDIAEFAETENLPVKDWSVTIREQIDVERAANIRTQLKKEGLKESKTEKENSQNYLLRDRRNFKDLNVYYKVIVHSGKAELIVVLEGQKWTQDIKQSYVNKKTTIKDEFFTNKAQTFACLSVSDDAIIDSDYFFKDLTKTFNIQHENKQFDNTKNSAHKFIFYGYTPLWTQKINLGNSKLNIQVAVTENATGDLTYTIGTPILINEY
ncbi:YwmB family TATA-box binding protein [Oceanobacillus kapialis]|uniref:YwmB family TATA-box binding protein n=1 Tax=Oceanobacillus kapialis TaxID=481353 RepID=UPI00384EBF91